MDLEKKLAQSPSVNQGKVQATEEDASFGRTSLSLLTEKKKGKLSNRVLHGRCCALSSLWSG